MRWINRIIEYLIFFGLGVIVGWHPTFAGVKAFLLNGTSFAVVLGVVIQVGGLLRDWFKDRKEERAKEQERVEQKKNKAKELEYEKKNLSINLLYEIKVNQKQLKPFSDSVVKVIDGNMELSIGDIFPNEFYFEKSSYLIVIDKLGLLNINIIEGLKEYYFELGRIKEEYKKMEPIHGQPYGHLKYLRGREYWPKIKMEIIKPEWKDIEGFLRHAKKVYDCGEELIKELSMP